MSKLKHFMWGIIITMLVPLSSYATDIEVEQGYLTYLVDVTKDDCSVWRCDWEDEDTTVIEIPATIEYSGKTYNVTEIAGGAFLSATFLTSITMPESIETIGTTAFSKCESLQSITIPSSVTSIEEFAFAYCSSLETVTCEMTTPCEVWGLNIFISCTNLNTLYVPRGCVEAYKSKGWTSADAILEMGTELYEVAPLTYFIDTETGDAIVYSCDKTATAVTVPATFEYENVTYTVHTIGDDAFSNCTQLESIELPSELTAIGSNSFNNCSMLQSIVLPSELRTIGNNSFNNCEILQSIVLPSKLTAIGENAFRSCSNLSLVRCLMETPVVIVFDNIFSNCNSINTVYIPVGCREAYEEAGWASNGKFELLEEGELPATINCTIANISYRIVPETGDVTVTKYSDDGTTTDLIVPETISYDNKTYTVNAIGEKAFYANSRLLSITLPSSLETVADNSFYDCSKLKEIHCLMERTVRVSSSTYSICYSLKAIYVPDGYVKTYLYAGWANDNIYQILEEGEELKPEVVYNYTIYRIDTTTGEAIAAKSMDDTSTSITIQGSITYNGTAYPVTTIGYKLLDSYYVTNVSLPSSITTIDSYAFDYCSQMKSINIPEGVTKIGEWAFATCYALETVTLPSSLELLGEYAFMGCTNLNEVHCKKEIPQEITASTVFASCRYLCNIYVPEGCIESYEEAGWKSVDDCYDILEEGTAPKQILTTINNDTYKLFIETKTAKFWEAYFSYTLQRIEVPSSITYNNETYTVTTLASNAIGTFWGTEIILPEGLTTLETYAISGCSGVESLTLPSTIISIAPEAINNLEKLVEVKCLMQDPAVLEDEIFSTTPYLCNVYVPKGTKESYIKNGWEAVECSYDILEEGETPNKIIYTDSDYNYMLTLDAKEANILTAVSPTSYSGEVTMPSTTTADGVTYTITKIGTNPYSYYSPYITAITLPSHLREICKHAFYIYSITTVTLPETVEIIGESAFLGCPLESIYIPINVRIIKNGALSPSKYIEVASENSYFSSKDGALFNKAQDTLIQYPTGSTATSYIIHDGVTSIDSRSTFLGAASLTLIELPASIAYIPDNAFAGCTKLYDIHIKATTPPEISTWTFLDYLSEGKTVHDMTLHIPEGSKIHYEAAEGWCEFGTIVEDIFSSKVEQEMQDEIKVAVTRDGLQVQGVEADTPITIYNMQGGIVAVVTASQHIALPRGIYIVRVKNEIVKVAF